MTLMTRRVSRNWGRPDLSTSEDECGQSEEGLSERRLMASRTCPLARGGRWYSPILRVLAKRDARVTDCHIEQL
jgi:hypothetical protein